MNPVIARFERLADAWLFAPFHLFYLCVQAVIGCLFWIEASVRDAAFSVETFGRFALMFPAEFWAGLMIAGSLMTFAGLMRPPHRPAILLGSGVNLVQFCALGYSAALTGGELVVGLYALLMFAPSSAITFVAGVRHDGG